MEESPAHITLVLDTSQPIEIGDFVSSFTSLSSQFDRFIKETRPDLSSDAQMYVREVRQGSIIADLIPHFTLLAPIIADMEKVLIVEEFVRLYGDRLSRYFGLGRDEKATKSDLKDFSDAVAAIARDPDASARIEAAYFEDGEKKIRAAFTFDTQGAKRAAERIEEHKRALERPSDTDRDRVLMTFSQSNVKDTPLGKRTSERVVIEAVAPRDLPLIYASELAEERIKHEIREADENVYKKGFIVDVNIEMRAGKPVGYRVKNLHQVIDLPD